MVTDREERDFILTYLYFILLYTTSWAVIVTIHPPTSLAPVSLSMSRILLLKTMADNELIIFFYDTFENQDRHMNNFTNCLVFPNSNEERVGL